jgi:DNA-directed RNA polymerase subunit M/transcription elongation factor TFIIS
MYISTSEESSTTQLTFECRNCSHSQTFDDSCVINSDYTDDQASYKQLMSSRLKHDVTLPRVDNIPCPTCTAKKQKGVVLFVKYDTNLRYLYMCETCDTFWKSQKS